MTYPSQEAHALEGIWLAAAFSKLVDTSFFMPRLRISRSKLRELYDISDAPLRIRPMYLDHSLSRFISFYEQFVSYYLRFQPQWAGFRGKKILYVRAPKELIYWASLRERQKWLKDWIFIFEADDVLGLDPNQLHGTNPFELHDGPEGQQRQALFRALLNFDLIVCVTQALADDLRLWSNNALQPHVIRHASPLLRTSSPPRIRSFDNKIVLGYIGTIDQYRGVNILLDAMRFLPQNYSLRLVGKFRQEKGVDPDWLNKYMEDPQISSRVELIGVVPIHAVAAEIDRCDIVLQPASNDLIDSRYASPMKSYDYKVRGKPIIAADVPGHHELFQDGQNAIFYHLDPQYLADCIINLVKHPYLAERIARKGWEQAVDYTYPRRAEKILSLALRNHGRK